MKTLIYQITETFENGNSNVLLSSENKKEVLNYYNNILEKDGYQPEESKSFDIALEKLLFNESGSLKSCETIREQTLYEEGTIDRMNYKGENASIYGFTSFWDAKQKQLIYTMFFQGKEKEIVMESELKNWYYI